tara:strand:- start:44 stop:484 length:441 start_codon:yes stop_codon:yes gene_type:complete
MEKQLAYRKFRNPLALIEQGKEARNIYYDSIGQEFSPTDRQFKNSQPRIAIGVALSRHIGDSLTADVLHKDRTTIIHYKKTHDANLKNWDGYALLSETAEYIVNSYFEGAAKLDRLQYIDKTVNELLKEKLQIQTQLHEQLQIQDH